MNVIRNTGLQLSIATVLAVLLLGWLGYREGSFPGLWLTPDQQGVRAMKQLEFSMAADLFEDSSWKGTAAYEAGRYEDAAAFFGRLPSAVGFFNRGNALMRNREYGKAISAYEQAVADEPDWPEAQDNLALAHYVLDYIEDAREASDTGDESELSADDYAFDNTRERGREMEITQESTLELQSAEKWMRSVDTETRDFLRSRFALEAAQRGQP
ncbi:MAG: tetratricopeptide repeat protein [Pseudomonadota bacterium]